MELHLIQGPAVIPVQLHLDAGGVALTDAGVGQGSGFCSRLANVGAGAAGCWDTVALPLAFSTAPV